MSNLPIYEMLAQAFAREGVDTVFSLMGDGNMHWARAMSKIDGMRVFHARHEHCACGMAMGYYSATGKVGVATVTCGPGVTQIATALTTASRAGVPMVVFAGESPINARWYNQALDQAPLVTATGAHYVRAHSAARMYDSVREAFYVARYEHRPAVLGVPYDLQKLPLPGRRSRRWRRRAAPCWRPRCRRAECSITIPSRSAWRAAFPPRLPASCLPNPTS